MILGFYFYILRQLHSPAREIREFLKIKTKTKNRSPRRPYLFCGPAKLIVLFRRTGTAFQHQRAPVAKLCKQAALAKKFSKLGLLHSCPFCPLMKRQKRALMGLAGRSQQGTLSVSEELLLRGADREFRACCCLECMVGLWTSRGCW